MSPIVWQYITHLKISSVMAGVPFPLEAIARLKEQVDREMADIREKQKKETIELDLNAYLDFIGSGNDEAAAAEEIPDFTIFEKE